MEPRKTKEWIVLIPLTMEDVAVIPEPGIEIYTNVATFGTVFHRAAKAKNHTLYAMPKCLLTAEMENLDITARVPMLFMEYSAARAVATPCPNCKFPKVLE